MKKLICLILTLALAVPLLALFPLPAVAAGDTGRNTMKDLWMVMDVAFSARQQRENRRVQRKNTEDRRGKKETSAPPLIFKKSNTPPHMSLAHRRKFHTVRTAFRTDNSFRIL